MVFYLYLFVCCALIDFYNVYNYLKLRRVPNIVYNIVIVIGCCHHTTTTAIVTKMV